MKNIKKVVNKQLIGISILVLVLSLIGVKKFIWLSLPDTPEGKDCSFIYPKIDSAELISVSDLDVIKTLSEFNFIQVGGVINDASCLNQTPILGVIDVQSEEELQKILAIALENDLTITISGEKHSMGGQAFHRNGLVISLDSLNSMNYNQERNSIQVQAGARWKEVQMYLDNLGLSLKAVQSINIFSVGGTVAVNAHGIAHSPGPIAETIRSMRVMLVNGEVKDITPESDPELFSLIVGGYGLFGIILEVELEVVKNEGYAWSTDYMDYKEFPAFYYTTIKDNPELGLFYARVSISPISYLTEVAAHSFYRVPDLETPIHPLKEPSLTWANRFIMNFSKTGSTGRWLRWTLEKKLQPKVHSCISRNQLFNDKEVCLVSRNQEMYDSMGYLMNRLKDTDILQEYFVRPERMPEFIDGLREIVRGNGANLINITIRIVEKDEISFLPYAKEDMLAFVLYFNQKLNKKDSEKLKATTTQLIDLISELEGTYYLPYQLYYSKAQLEKVYPQINSFFELKEKYDPQEILVNKFYQRYKSQTNIAN
jgi:FAD/FMN-containing dehydrogenase